MKTVKWADGGVDGVCTGNESPTDQNQAIWAGLFENQLTLVINPGIKVDRGLKFLLYKRCFSCLCSVEFLR